MQPSGLHPRLSSERVPVSCCTVPLCLGVLAAPGAAEAAPAACRWGSSCRGRPLGWLQSRWVRAFPASPAGHDHFVLRPAVRSPLTCLLTDLSKILLQKFRYCSDTWVCTSQVPKVAWVFYSSKHTSMQSAYHVALAACGKCLPTWPHHSWV